MLIFMVHLNTIAALMVQAIFSFLGPFVDYMGFNILGVIFSAVLLIAVMLIPESPHVSVTGIDVKPKISIFQRKYIGGVLIGIGMMFLQPFSGICGILTKLADIFSYAGLDMDPDYQSGISIFLLLFSNVIGSLTIDKIGQNLTDRGVRFISANPGRISICYRWIRTSYNFKESMTPFLQRMSSTSSPQCSH